MLIKFFGGSGGGGAIAKYLVDPERAGREEAPPEVLRGDIEQTRELIDSQDRKWTFTTGVISFAPEDAPTPAQQEAVMNDFERLAFAGLEKDQYDITWVRHSHTGQTEGGGRVELHFLVPRMELSTGKALNIAPPGWEKSFAPLRDAWNYQEGWARPDDPDRARTHGYVQESKDRDTNRTTITSILETKIELGLIEDRADIIAALKDEGLEVPRAGKEYITALNPATGDRWRLKGRIYEQGWSRDAEFVRETDRQIGGGPQSTGGRDPALASAARGELERIIAGRAEANRGKYPNPALGDREGGAREPGQDDLRDSRDRDHPEKADPKDHALERGDGGDRGDAALGDNVLAGDQRDAEQRRDGQPADGREAHEGTDQRAGSDRGGAGEGAGGADAAGDRANADGLRARDAALHSTGEVTDGQADPVRESLVARVRELGQRMRDLGGQIQRAGRAVYAAVAGLFREDQSDQRAADSTRAPLGRSDASLGRANNVHQRTDRQCEQVADSAERVEGLVEIEKAQDRMDERIQALLDRQKQRGERER